MPSLHLGNFWKCFSPMSSVSRSSVVDLAGISSKCSKPKRLTSSLFQQQRNSSSAASKKQVELKFDLSRVHACEELLEYRFREPLLLWEALQPKGSYICNMMAQSVQWSRYKAGNKRLAIVGYELMDVFLSEKWYRTDDSTCESSWRPTPS